LQQSYDGNRMTEKKINQNGKPVKRKAKKSSGSFVVVFIKHSILAVSAFGLAGILFVLTMDRIVMPFYQKTGKEIRTPNLIGTDYKDAQTKVRKMHLSISRDSLEFHNRFPENVITFQYPLAGTWIKTGRIIKVNVSKGAKPLYIPNVVGMPRRDAELRVKKAGFEIGETPSIHSNNYTRGLVAGQDPPGGREVADNTVVVLYISDGQPETNATMPYLIELSLSAAQDTLLSHNFDLGMLQVHYVDAPEMLPETVIDQHPDAGDLTHTSNEVTLDVSKAE